MHTLNRAYLASLCFAQISFRETSNTLGMLYAIRREERLVIKK